jgi:membrane-bound lytic murein transglycosylase B
MRLIALPLLLMLAACASSPDMASAPPMPEAMGPVPPPAPPPPPVTMAPAGPSSASNVVNQQVANPTEAGFRVYMDKMRNFAPSRGISEATWDAAMAGVSMNRKSIELSTPGGGGMGRVSSYLARVDASLVSRGRNAFDENAALLNKVGRDTGVDPAAIVGIWGNETSYGNVLGNFYVVEALASLAYEGRRRSYFEDELFAALTLLQEGLATRAELTGSYAGALGQVQFMPSNILKLGVDGDGNGERDLRGSLADAFYSCANYLLAHGWRPGEPWLAEARLPSGFRWELAGPDITMTAAEWDAMGVTTVDGRKISGLVAPDAQISVLLPGGHRGIPMIAFPNYRRFLDYNPSQSYAIAVSHLGNRVKGGSDWRASWPADLQGMTSADLKTMQGALAALGYDVGIDGRFGDKTRKAVRAYQLSIGMPADGYPTQAVLARLRGGVS